MAQEARDQVSATGRGAERVVSDYYPTPAWCVARLLEAVLLPGGAWLEPAAGDGAIIRAVNEDRNDVTWSAVELREECAPALRTLLVPHGGVLIADFLQVPKTVQFNVAVLNPPFSHAQAFIEKCQLMAVWVCALERLNFLEGEERNDFFRYDMPDVYVLPNRPSFTGEGTDSIAYAWFVWGPEQGRNDGRIVVLPTTPASERRVPKLVLPPGVGKPPQGSLL